MVFVVVRLVIVDDAEVSSDVEAVIADRLAIDVVASVEVPVTTKVLVVVAFVVVKLSINAVRAWKYVAKRFDEEA